MVPVMENLYRESQTSHLSGRHRATFDVKKLLTLWTVLCGGVVILLWGFFSFPKKFGATRAVRNKTCDDEMKICMNSWNKLNQNCFFIFQHKNSWLTAQETCQHYEGTLVKFNNKIELETLMNHVGALGSSAWIGLNKQNIRKSWVWTDGSRYNHLKTIQEHGDCAFMHKNGIDSTSCNDLKDYICSKIGQCP
ncbi:C-type lectin domain family 2 member F-like [Peromyscus californicus insignis]|uniref:C-type lectin domain family 2 member F-like n=1 Tax=Peromyscus californicus insignis TaxID=564181 RepID=UPI0022A68021|nr:C-type lectin domain family 2 member F-like [Peromyscus californicus insignis]